MLGKYYIGFLSCILLQVASSVDITLTFLYDQQSRLDCGKTNSDSNYVWLKDNAVVNTSTDPNLDISSTGFLTFDRFAFSDTGSYHCEDSIIYYTVIIDCPPNSEPNFLGNQCICSAGATSNTLASHLDCDPCPYSTYKPHPGNYACFSCGTSLVTEREGSISELSCVCPLGYGLDGSLCVPCPSDFYQDKFEETQCQPCPTYSSTPEALGEADAIGFTSESDCICQYSPDNAQNSTCYPFVTQPNVTLIEIEHNVVTVGWITQVYARAENGAFRGIISGYHLEARENNELSYIQFTQKYTPSDYTPGDQFSPIISGLTPSMAYTILVNAYTKSTSFEDGPPFILNITTLPAPTTTPATTQTTSSSSSTVSTKSSLPPETTETTVTTISTSTPVKTESTVTTASPTTSSKTDSHTTESTVATTQATGTATRETTVKSTVQSTATIFVWINDNTASYALSVIVTLLAIVIVILVLFLVVRFWLRRKKRSQRLRYVSKERMRHIGPQPQYGLYSNAIYSNAEANDSLI